MIDRESTDRGTTRSACTQGLTTTLPTTNTAARYSFRLGGQELFTIVDTPGFQDARRSLRAQLDAELARLSPEAQTDIQDNLDVIHEAIVEINAALKQEPDNVLLQSKLLGAYREELTLLRRVSGLTRNVMTRNDI